MAAVYQDIHREIIELCKEGDPKAQFHLYSLYAKAMFNICMRMLNNKEEAEDLLQDSFCDAFIKLDTFRYESSFGAWLKRIVINKCINHINRKKVDLIFADQEVEVPDKEEIIEYKNIEFNVQQIHHAVEQLPDGYRIIFSLYALEGYDHLEISQIMNISESTSKSQYMRAKQKIKDILKTNQDERQARRIHQ